MADLVDLEQLPEAPPAQAWSLRPVEDIPTAYQGVTIKPHTFKAKVTFRWREERQGANTWHHAVCNICHSPLWMAMDTMRSRLTQSTSLHKDRHYWAATGNTPTSLPEGKR